MQSGVDGTIRVEISEVSKGAVPGMGGGGAAPSSGPATSAAISGNIDLSLKGILKSLAGVGAIGTAVAFMVQAIKRSVIFSNFFNAFMTIFMSFVDLMLIPLIPVLQKFLHYGLQLFQAFQQGGWSGLFKEFGIIFEDIGSQVNDFFKKMGDEKGGFWQRISDTLNPWFDEGYADVSFWGKVKESLGILFFGDPENPFWVQVTDALETFFEGSETTMGFFERIETVWNIWTNNDVVPEGASFWDKAKATLGTLFGGDPANPFWNQVVENIRVFFEGEGNVIGFWDRIGIIWRMWTDNDAVPVNQGFWERVGLSMDLFLTGVASGGFWTRVGEGLDDFFTDPIATIWTWVTTAMWNFFTWPIRTFWDWVTDALASFFTPFKDVANYGGILGDITTPSYQTGTSYVPQDMYAYLHKGERVVPASQNVMNFHQQFIYSGPTSYLAGRDMLGGFNSDLNRTLGRM